MESDSNNVNIQEKPKEELAKSAENVKEEIKTKTEESEQSANTNGIEIAEEVLENGYKNEEAPKEDVNGVKNGQDGDIVPVAKIEEDSKPVIIEEAPVEASAETAAEIAREAQAAIPAEAQAEISAEAQAEIPADAPKEVPTEVQTAAPADSKDVAEEKLIKIEDEKEAKSTEIEAAAEEAILEVEQATNEAIETKLTEEAEEHSKQIEEQHEQKELEEIPLKIETEIQPPSTDQDQLDPEILKRIENHLDSLGISNYTLKVEPYTEVRDNPSTKTFRLQISSSTTELNWLVRAAPPADSVRHMVEIGRLYQNEELTYRKLLPAYQKLEDERSLIDTFDSSPKYHLSSTDFLKEFVVISDVTRDYLEKGKSVGLTWYSVNLAMKAFGKLHALSYALKIKKPDLFSELSDIFKNNFAVVNEMKEDQKAIFENHALTTLDPTREDAVYKKFSKLIQNLPKVFSEISTNEYSVIGYCCSKLAFTLAPINSRHAVCFLDFQNAKYGSPAYDLSHFLYCYTDKKLRESHYQSAIKLYYYTLCGHLNELGYDPEKIIPYEVLDAEMKRCSIVGLCTAILELAATFKDDLSEPIFTSRVKDSIIDFNGRGYFPNHF